VLDLARRRGPWKTADFRYRVVLQRAGNTSVLTPAIRPGGELCVQLPHAAADGGSAPSDRSRYDVVLLDNGQARYPLALHLYDLGPTGGFSLVGLERPEATFDEVSRVLVGR
jgi:hypothetical protein